VIPCAVLLPGVDERSCGRVVGPPRVPAADGPAAAVAGGARPALPDAFPKLGARGGSGVATRAALPEPVCDRRAAPHPASRLGYPTYGTCVAVGGAPPAGTQVRGLVIMVAAGGWMSSPAHVRAVLDSGVPTRWNRYGYLTLVIEHTPGANGHANVLAQFDRWRAALSADPRYGSAFPICMRGGSSAGHYALMTAAKRSNVSCVISEGAPIDLQTLPAGSPTVNGDAVKDIAQYWFGSALPAWSPLRYVAPALTAPALVGHLVSDRVVPIAPTDSQVRPFLSTHPRAQSYVLTPPSPSDPVTTSYFEHQSALGAPGVGRNSLCVWYDRERAFAPRAPGTTAPTYDPCA
jgi:hypothetical protein